MSTTKEEEEELCCQVFAEILGIEPDEPFYSDLYPLAKKLLYILPQGWEVIVGQADLDGIPIFFNKNENISQWNHPLEADHLETVEARRLKLMSASPATSRPGSRPVSAHTPEPTSRGNNVSESPSVQNSSFLSEIEIIFAQLLGIETGEENAFQLIFLAKELLYALPDGWEVISGQSDMGIIPYFFDSVNQVSYWTHPYEQQCIEIIENKRIELHNAKHGTNVTSVNKQLFNITESDEQSMNEQQISVEEVNMMELTELDVLFANVLGVDVENEKYAMQLCYLAKELLFELPDNWEVSVSSSELGTIPIFFDLQTQNSYWTHPLEEEHKQRILEARALLESQSTPQSGGAVEVIEVQEYVEADERMDGGAGVAAGGSTVNLNEPSAVSTIAEMEDSVVVQEEETFKEVYDAPIETAAAAPPTEPAVVSEPEVVAPPSTDKVEVASEPVPTVTVAAATVPAETAPADPEPVTEKKVEEQEEEEADPFVTQVQQSIEASNQQKQLQVSAAETEGEDGDVVGEGLTASPKHVIDKEHIVDYLGGGSFSGVVEESDKRAAPLDVVAMLEAQQKQLEADEAEKQRVELDRLQQLVQEQQELERRLEEEAVVAAAAAAAAAEEEARRVQAIQQAKEQSEAEKLKKRDQKLADEEQKRLRMLSDLKMDKALNLVVPALLEQCFAECARVVIKEIAQKADVEALAERACDLLFPATVDHTLQCAVNEAAVLERFLILHQIQAAELMAKNRELFPVINDEIAASPYKFTDDSDSNSMVDLDSFVTKLTIDTTKPPAAGFPSQKAVKGGRSTVVTTAAAAAAGGSSASAGIAGGHPRSDSPKSLSSGSTFKVPPKLTPQRSDSKLPVAESPKAASAAARGSPTAKPAVASFAPVSPTASVASKSKTAAPAHAVAFDSDNLSAASALTDKSGSLHSGSVAHSASHQAGAHSSPSESALFNKRVIRVKTDYLKMLRSNKVVDSKLPHNMVASPDKGDGVHEEVDITNELIQEKLNKVSPKKKHGATATAAASASVAVVEPEKGQFQRLNQLEPICGGPPVNPNQIKWHLLGSYEIHKEAVKSRQVIVHIVNLDSLGTILIDPKDNFIDSVLEQEIAENREKERQIKTLMSQSAPGGGKDSGITAQLEALLGNRSRPSSPDVEVSKRPMDPNLIIGRMKSTSEKLSKIRIRRDLARQQWVIETDDQAIKKIINRHKKKGKVENSLLESSATTFTLKPKETKIIDVTSVDQIGVVKTFGSLHKLPTALLTQTLPQKTGSAEAGPNSVSSPVEDGFDSGGGRKGGRAKKRGAAGAGTTALNSNNNKEEEDEDHFDPPDFASSHSLSSRTLNIGLRQGSAEGPLKLPSITGGRNISTS